METNSITDYLQSIQDLIPALQIGLLPDGVVLLLNEFINKIRPLAWR